MFLDRIVLGFLYFFAFCSTITVAGASVGFYGAMLAAIICYIKKPVRVKFDKGLLLVICLFFSGTILSLLGSYNRLETLNTIWTNFTRMFPLFIVLTFVTEDKKRYNLIFTMLLGMAITDGVAIWQGLHGNYRANAFIAAPITLGGVLIQLVPFALVLGLQDRQLSKKIRSGLLVLTLVALIAILFNGTRGAWLAVAGGLIVYAIISLRTNKKALFLMLGTFCLLGTVIFQVPGIKDRLYTIGDPNMQSNSERVLIWQSAIQMFRDHPLTGVGAGNFADVYAKSYRSPLAKEYGIPHAHNSYLNQLAEGGIFGLIGFLCLTGFLLVHFCRSYYGDPSNHWALSGLLVMLIWLGHGFTENNFGSSVIMRLFWILMGITLGTTKLITFRKEQPKT